MGIPIVPNKAISAKSFTPETRICVSFSGGETSGYMAQLIKREYVEFDPVFVFANTGQEREETLEFVQECSDHFGLDVTWIECVPSPTRGEGCTAKIVDFKSASRDGTPFEAAIRKYGIPNSSFPHCSRVLKREAIEAWQRQVGLRSRSVKPVAAIGIRLDEFDRASASAVKDLLWYPLIHDHPAAKQDINAFWADQPFRLQIKSWEGNCSWCWKKTDRKLAAIAATNPSAFNFPRRMEALYGDSRPQKDFKGEGPIRFFRKNRSVDDIFRIKADVDALFDERYLMPDTQLQMDLFDKEFSGCQESCNGYE